MEENRIRGRLNVAYADYKGKYNNWYDSLDFCAQKHVIHDRFTSHRPRIWKGYLVFQPERRQESVRRECQEQQKI